MTLEELAESDSATWKTFTDAQLEELCRPWFPITRPEHIVRVCGTKTQPAYVPPAKARALAALKEAGVDVAEILYAGKKKR